MSRQKTKLATFTPLLDATTPEPVDRVIGVFREDLPGVAFPDVSLELLEQAAEAVRERVARVEDLRHRVAVAEADLAAARGDLATLAQRGLAYAKVFAANSADLAEKLAKIDLSEAPKRKRRRVGKVEAMAVLAPANIDDTPFGAVG
jgi:hypothetical protein